MITITKRMVVTMLTLIMKMRIIKWWKYACDPFSRKKGSSVDFVHFEILVAVRRCTKCSFMWYVSQVGIDTDTKVLDSWRKQSQEGHRVTVAYFFACSSDRLQRLQTPFNFVRMGHTHTHTRARARAQARTQYTHTNIYIYIGYSAKQSPLLTFVACA